MITLRYQSIMVGGLLVVIGLAFDDGAGAVDLFGEDKAYHLVGEGHLREGELFVGAGIDGRGEAVGASDDEDEPAGGVALLFEPAGKLDAAQLTAMFVEQDNGVGRLDELQDLLSLGRLLLVLREALRILEFRNRDELEGHVVTDTLGIVGDACLEVAVGGLTHEDQQRLHIFLSLDGFFLDERVELALVAVEHVDVDIALNTGHATVGTELPVGQAHIGLILAVAGYPYTVVALQVGLLRQVVVDEHLVDVKDGFHAGMALDGLQPDAYLAKQSFDTARLGNLGVRGLHVEHGR